MKKLLLVCAYIAAKIRATSSSAEVAETIKSVLHLSTTPEITDGNSAMISPTRDKAIIHRHASGYHKFASGNSRDAVAGEIKLYQLLAQLAPENFCVSEISDINETPVEVSFFMKQIPEKTFEAVPPIAELLPLLKEFFSIERGDMVEYQTVLEELKKTTSGANLIDRIDHCGIAGKIRRGWAHRDFKPWNLKKSASGKFLLFDFEAARNDGLPLEDFFNYLIEPALTNSSPEAVDRKIQKEFRLAEKLLAMLDIDVNQLPNCYKYYLLERSVYYDRNGKVASSEKYQRLYDLYTAKR